MITRKYVRNREYVYRSGSSRTQADAMNCVRGRQLHTTWYNGMSFFASMSEREFLYAYALEKHRHKSNQQLVQKGKKPLTTKIVKNGHWNWRVFRFPLRDVVSFKQHARHFEIMLRSA